MLIPRPRIKGGQTGGQRWITPRAAKCARDRSPSASFSCNFKQSVATRSSDVARTPATSELERAMIDAGASGRAGRRAAGWGTGRRGADGRRGREREREREANGESEEDRRIGPMAWGNLINVNAAATAGATRRVWQSLICNSPLPLPLPLPLSLALSPSLSLSLCSPSPSFPVLLLPWLPPTPFSRPAAPRASPQAYPLSRASL